MADLLVRSIALDCDIAHAFAAFTDKIDLWWPRGHRKHRDGALRLEAMPGGALIDRAPDGTEWTMGRVRSIDPPSGLDLDWYPGSPATPTAVEVRFAVVGDGTEIAVIHRPLEQSHTVWPERAATFARNWDAVLSALKTFAEEA